MPPGDALKIWNRIGKHFGLSTAFNLKYVVGSSETNPTNYSIHLVRNYVWLTSNWEAEKAKHDSDHDKSPHKWNSGPVYHNLSEKQKYWDRMEGKVTRNYGRREYNLATVQKFQLCWRLFELWDVLMAGLYQRHSSWFWDKDIFDEWHKDLEPWLYVN